MDRFFKKLFDFIFLKRIHSVTSLSLVNRTVDFEMLLLVGEKCYHQDLYCTKYLIKRKNTVVFYYVALCLKNNCFALQKKRSIKITVYLIPL